MVTTLGITTTALSTDLVMDGRAVCTVTVPLWEFKDCLGKQMADHSEWAGGR